MNTLNILLQAAQPAQQGSAMSMWIMLILIFIVMWIFMIRPQRKQQKELENFRNSLSKGDKVVTIGGIYGKVVEIQEKTLLLEVDNNVKIKVDKTSVVKDFSDAARQ
ncbi:MAG: preprotein translocase subunit YajC [Bacteroidales bacterium]|nr:preprotein translocase subunit YajC [Bacteroidales bacterium]